MTFVYISVRVSSEWFVDSNFLYAWHTLSDDNDCFSDVVKRNLIDSFISSFLAFFLQKNFVEIVRAKVNMFNAFLDAIQMEFVS